MTTTPDLIESMVAAADPVKRLRSPLARAASWLLFAVAVIGALTILHGLRPDFAERIRQPLFCAGVAAAVLTGALATVAAFMASLPDRSRLWLTLPLPAAVLWVSSVSYGCMAHWVGANADSIHGGDAINCFGTLLMSSLPLSLVLFWMLRHVAKIRPRGPILIASLAVAALTATALALLHRFDASIMILLWNFGAAGLVVAADMFLGQKMINGRRFG